MDIKNQLDSIVRLFDSLSFEEQQVKLGQLRTAIDDIKIATLNKDATKLGRFKIMTWNLKMLDSTQIKKIERIAKVANENHVNIFCTQEIKTASDQRGEDCRDNETCVKLCQALNDSSSPNRWNFCSVVAGKGFLGTEAISIFYVNEFAELVESWSGDDYDSEVEFKHRVPIVAKFRTLDDQEQLEFVIHNFHLIDGSREPEKLNHDVNCLQTYVENTACEVRGDGTAFHMVVGDFNCEYDALDVEQFLGPFIDCGFLPENCTIGNSIYDFMFPVIYGTGYRESCVEEVKISDEETLLNNGQQVSDHFPVLFTFNLVFDGRKLNMVTEVEKSTSKTENEV